MSSNILRKLENHLSSEYTWSRWSSLGYSWGRNSLGLSTDGFLSVWMLDVRMFFIKWKVSWHLDPEDPSTFNWVDICGEVNKMDPGWLSFCVLNSRLCGFTPEQMLMLQDRTCVCWFPVSFREARYWHGAQQMSKQSPAVFRVKASDFICSLWLPFPYPESPQNHPIPQPGSVHKYAHYQESTCWQWSACLINTRW